LPVILRFRLRPLVGAGRVVLGRVLWLSTGVHAEWVFRGAFWLRDGVSVRLAAAMLCPTVGEWLRTRTHTQL